MRQFKDWAIPGPVPPGASRPVELSADESLDAISGHFRIYQLRKGHRFSTDDVLTAWYGTTWVPSARRVLDLGSGIGSVGMIAAWRLPAATFVTIEAQDDGVRLARKSAEYNGLLDRYDIRHGDFRDAHVLSAGERFDLVLGSPPYFPRGTGIEGEHPQKAACRFELRGDIRDYCAVASAHIATGGVFACVFPEEQRARVEDAAAAAALLVVRRRPVVFREGRAAARDALRDDAARRSPPTIVTAWQEPPLVIRAADGSIHSEYAMVKLAVGFPP